MNPAEECQRAGRSAGEASPPSFNGENSTFLAQVTACKVDMRLLSSASLKEFLRVSSSGGINHSHRVDSHSDCAGGALSATQGGLRVFAADAAFRSLDQEVFHALPVPIGPCVKRSAGSASLSIPREGYPEIPRPLSACQEVFDRCQLSVYA